MPFSEFEKGSTIQGNLLNPFHYSKCGDMNTADSWFCVVCTGIGYVQMGFFL